MTEKNKILIRVLGLQRSGNHAIILWILSQFSNKTKIFLNDVQHGDHNPFSTCYSMDINGINVDKPPEIVKNLKNKIILYSYEDSHEKMISENFIESVFNARFEENQIYYFGESFKVFTVLIIRDPFNFFASRLKKINLLTGSKNIDVIKENWIRTATLFANQSTINHIKHPVIFINYNKWFSEKQYRKSLSKKIGGTYSDKSFTQVASYGGGSSFDNTNYSKMTFQLFWSKKAKLMHIQPYKNILKNLKKIFNKGAQNMDVLQRWHSMRSNKDFQYVFSDPRMLKYSEQIFGYLPETKEFVDYLLKHPFKPTKATHD